MWSSGGYTLCKGDRHGWVPGRCPVSRSALPRSTALVGPLVQTPPRPVLLPFPPDPPVPVLKQRESAEGPGEACRREALGGGLFSAVPSPGFLFPFSAFFCPRACRGGSAKQDTLPGHKKLGAPILRSKQPLCRLKWGFCSSTHSTRTWWRRRSSQGRQTRTNGMLRDAVHVAALLLPFGWARPLPGCCEL